MSTSLQVFGKTIRALREERHLTVEKLASKTKSRPSIIIKLESGTLDPPLTLVMSLAKALKIPVTAILISPPEPSYKLTVRMSHFIKYKKEIRRRFEKHYKPTSPNECWPWQGSKNKGGYGRFVVYANTPDYAHRIAHELYKGPIPHAHNVHHECGNPSCVNPKHLELKLPPENLALRNKWLLSRR